MDALVLVVVGASGCVLGVTALGLVLWARNLSKRLDSATERLAANEQLIDTVVKNTKAIDPTKAALDDERDFQEALMGTDLMMGYIGRKSPGALKQLWERHAPQQFLKGRRVN